MSASSSDSTARPAARLREEGTGSKRAPARGEAARQRRRGAGSAAKPATRAKSARSEAKAKARATVEDPTVDSLQLFFQQASRHPLLTAAEEVELSKRVERGDVAAKDRMINSNLRLVISVARKYQGQGLSMGDLAQEGMLGLIRAVEKFDWRRGYKFSTYGTLWIQQSIQRGLQNSGRTIRIPVHVGQRERKVRRFERALAAELGRDPTDEEIAVAAELPEEQVHEVRDLARSLASLDQPIGEDGDTAFGDLLASDRPGPEEEVGAALGEERVHEVVAKLPEAERTVVKLRFGLAGSEVRTLRQAGAELGVSAERAGEIEERALRRLAESGELEELREAA